MLSWLWEDIPLDYCPLPVCTDGWGAYERFFIGTDHEICPKGSGKTSIAEAMNTKWRQRQSGLVRRSCGVSCRIEQDIAERFLILLERHNTERIERWQKRPRETLNN
jgi:hypothetical protein